MNEIIEQFVSAASDRDYNLELLEIAELFGAEHVGQGVDRIAFLLDEMIVKINFECDTQTRLEEYNYINLTVDGHKRGEWAIPAMQFVEAEYGMVAICEYIKGTGLDPCLRFDGSDNAFGVMDCHGGNVIETDDGTRYIIDLGYAHGYQTCILEGHQMVGDYECDHYCDGW